MTATEPRLTNPNQSVSRAAAILRAVADAPEGLTLSALARAVDLPRATVFRLVQALEDEHLLARTSKARRVVLGAGLMRLARGASPARSVLASGREHVEVLAAHSGEAVELSVITNHQAADAGEAMDVVMRIDASYMLRTAGFSAQSRYPLHATSAGKLLLADRADQAIDEIAAAGLERLARRTITDPAALRAEVATVRRRGFATTVDELEDGTAALAAPIRDADGRLVAILNVDGPSARLNERRRNEIAKEMLTTANRIETAYQR